MALVENNSKNGFEYWLGCQSICTKTMLGDVLNAYDHKKTPGFFARRRLCLFR